jgi:hypothetical protein
MQNQDQFTYLAAEIVSTGLPPLIESEVFDWESNSVSFFIGPLPLAVESVDMLPCW